MGRTHKHLPQWHEFGERLVWTIGGLIVLLIVVSVIAVIV
jgi:hypothetical protein